METSVLYWLNDNLTWVMPPKPAHELNGDEINMIERFHPCEAAFVDNEACDTLFGMRSNSYTLIKGKYDGRSTFMVSGTHGNEARTGLFII